jgi:hypothetical protein
MTMSRSQQRAGEILQGPGGEEIYRQLVRYAGLIAGLHGWRAGAMLPESASPRSIAHEVVVKVLTGVRSWDEGKEPSLLNALKGMVRSEIGHLYEKPEGVLVEPINIPSADGEERTPDSFPSTKLHANELNPEESVLATEKEKLMRAAMTLVLRGVEGNNDLERYVLALCDTDNPAEISAKTGLTIQRVYSATRELERIVRKISLARVIREAREEKNL